MSKASMKTVGLLGGGKSLLKHDLENFQIPLIGINESWRIHPTPWRIFIHPDLQFGPDPQRVFFPLPHKHRHDGEILYDLHKKWPTTLLCPIPWLRTPHRFRGFDEKLETDALSSGLIALELAVHFGFTSIHLLGFDSDTSAHFEDHPVIDPNLAVTWEERLLIAIRTIRQRGIIILRYRS